MFTIIGIMLAGIVVGVVLHYKKCYPKTGQYINYTIYVLLFILGLSVGSNQEITSNLVALGKTALIITIAGVFGSAIAALLISRIFFKHHEK